MANEKCVWMWDGKTHPKIINLLEQFHKDLRWCDDLENVASDALTGKVLCVCAALAIARDNLADDSMKNSSLSAPLNLLSEWIDDPTEVRSEEIYSLIFDNDDTHEIAWWALRVATSSVGNQEAGWALSALCSLLNSSSNTPEMLKVIAKKELYSRRL